MSAAPARRRGLGPAAVAALEHVHVPLAHGRGVDAVLVAQQRTAREQTPSVPRGMTATAAQVAARMVEADWLVVTTLVGDDVVADPQLHHAQLARALLTSLAVHGLASQLNAAGAALVTGCGLVPDAAARPGEVDRRTRARCPGCCVAVGVPAGVGSPGLDERCVDVVERRLEELG